MIPVKKVLTVAGSDSGAGAGIQADLKTMAALGAYGLSAITAVTAQNSVGVQGVHALPADFVGLQIDSICSDMGADAVKTGMLANGDIIREVAVKLEQYGLRNVVVDPVMVATSGDLLLEEEAIDLLVQELLPLATLVTPNLREAQVLSGITIRDESHIEEAARIIYRMGPKNVLIKGGHRAEDAIDVLFDGIQVHRFSTRRVQTKNTHGTGCTLSAALACYLAFGKEIKEAVSMAKDYLTGALVHGFQIGKGPGLPHHFYRWQRGTCL